MASEEQSNIKLRAAMLTDVGVVRDHNEDSAHVDSAHHFFIVADGMGGHAAGEVASAMAVQAVRETLEDARAQILEFVANPDEEGRKAMVGLLESAVRAAHQAVFERGSRETDKQGMGTTLDVVLIAGPEAFVAHVGDSRTYLVRDGRAAQITTDHTVAEVLVIEGKLSAEEAQMSPLRTILVNAIGVAADVGIEMAHVQLRPGDQLLLCSDGLHDYFPSEQEIADRLTKRTLDKSLNELVTLAKDRGGHDNITGIVIQVVGYEDAELDGAVEQAMDDSLSDGIPATIDRDDTLPVDHDRPIAGLVSFWADGEDEGEDEEDDGLAKRNTEPMNVIVPGDEGAHDVDPEATTAEREPQDEDDEDDDEDDELVDEASIEDERDEDK